LLTATLSLALAEITIVPETVAPLLGELIETVGAVLSCGDWPVLLIVTLTLVEAVLPAASLAVAESVWTPFSVELVSQLSE
jgi:hypothetical protein